MRANSSRIDSLNNYSRKNKGNNHKSFYSTVAIFSNQVIAACAKDNDLSFKASLVFMSLLPITFLFEWTTEILDVPTSTSIKYCYLFADWCDVKL